MRRFNVNLVIYLTLLITCGNDFFFGFLCWLIIIGLMNINFYIGIYLRRFLLVLRLLPITLRFFNNNLN